MKYIFFILFLLVTVNAHAKWYVFNADNRAVSIADYEPSKEDLQSRNEIAIQVDDDLNISLEDAEYVNGKIRIRKKSQSEKNEDQISEETAKEEQMIQDKIRSEAIKQLKAEGKVFKYVTK